MIATTPALVVAIIIIIITTTTTTTIIISSSSNIVIINIIIVVIIINIIIVIIVVVIIIIVVIIILVIIVVVIIIIIVIIVVINIVITTTTTTIIINIIIIVVVIIIIVVVIIIASITTSTFLTSISARWLLVPLSHTPRCPPLSAGRSLGHLCSPVGGQVACGRQAVQAGSDPALLRHWSCRTALHHCFPLWKQWQVRARTAWDCEEELWLAPWCNCEVRFPFSDVVRAVCVWEWAWHCQKVSKEREQSEEFEVTRNFRLQFSASQLTKTSRGLEKLVNHILPSHQLIQSENQLWNHQ